MSYKPYPVYKDSGIEWLGKIPEGWNLSPLFVILPEHMFKTLGCSPLMCCLFRMARLFKKMYLIILDYYLNPLRHTSLFLPMI